MGIATINKHSRDVVATADLIVADPPFEMNGVDLDAEIENFDAPHLLLITSMKQAIEFSKVTDMCFCFDLVLDLVSPKKSKSFHQPFYTHVNILYFKKNGVKTIFDRREGSRRDTYTSNFFPSIIRAPKSSKESCYQKNLHAAIDLLSYFSANSIIEPFAGSGTFSIAAHENKMQATAIECDKIKYEKLVANVNFFL